jgi:hypothetical protein
VRIGRSESLRQLLFIDDVLLFCFGLERGGGGRGAMFQEHFTALQ